MLRPNQKLELTYPDKTLVESPTLYLPRKIQVRYVRDLVKRPLTPLEFFNRPMLMRSRFLVSAIDLTHQDYRQYYLGNSLEYAANSPLRIGIYEKGGTRPIEIVTRSFGNTKRERIILANVLGKMLNEDLEDYVLGIFADDLRVVSE